MKQVNLIMNDQRMEAEARVETQALNRVETCRTTVYNRMWFARIIRRILVFDISFYPLKPKPRL